MDEHRERRALRGAFHHHDQPAPEPPVMPPTPPSARLPVTLDLSWPMLLRLGLAGVGEAGLDRLIVLRRRFGVRPAAIDGFEPDPRHAFARWLVQQGRLWE